VRRPAPPWPWRPESSDTASHLYFYQHRPDVGGVDDETKRLDRFRDEVRWNDLYYLLARGL
jgi:hypothetical protein